MQEMKQRKTLMQSFKVKTTPFEGQEPGTSGWRKITSVFMQPHYTENLIQSIFDTLGDIEGQTLVLGGDGRFYNRTVVQLVIKMAAANGFGRIIVGQAGLLSTPATSHAIRKNNAFGGLILSASHNPGGIAGDFGIKFNTKSGAPSPEKLTQDIFARTRSITEYHIADVPDIDINSVGEFQIGNTVVQVIDSVADYAALMENLFDFQAIRALFASGFRMCFDAMHAVNGPYAVDIFERRLKAPAGTVINAVPLEDFGGHQPDPNPLHAKSLMDQLMTSDAPDFGVATDGDGDRAMVVGRGLFINPPDSLAILARNAHVLPCYKNGIKGIARSMPTSFAADRVAAKLGVPLFETATGYKFFGTLLDADKVSICGEESFGAGSDHVREKDAIWVALFWLSVIAARKQTVKEIASSHWVEFGRDYFTRHDYEGVDIPLANKLMADLAAKLPLLAGTTVGNLKIKKADDFVYTDPVDGSVSLNQGFRIFFEDGARIVFRLSATGTQGAIIRIYMERYEPIGGVLDENPQVKLSDLIDIAETVAEVRARTGMNAPTVIT